jgi:magnesium transporter
MPTLTKLRYFSLIDAQNKRSRLSDFVIDLHSEDYPSISKIVYRDGKNELALPWSAVRELDERRRIIEVSDLDAGEKFKRDTRNGEVLLIAEMQDAQVLDLQHRRSTRANDLWIEERDGKLHLTAVDSTAGAILRRITRGLFGRPDKSDLSDWKYVEFFTAEPRATPSAENPHMRIVRLPPGEIASLSNNLPYLHAAQLVALLPDQMSTDTLEAMPGTRQLQVFEELPEDKARKILALMAPDLAADLIGQLKPETAKHFLEKLSGPKRDAILELLTYSNDEVGGIMTNDVVTVCQDVTIGEALDQLRDRLRTPDFFNLIYVVDDDKKRILRGVISLRNIVISDPEKTIGEVMDPHIVALGPHESAYEASYRLINSHLTALPVVGEKGQILGVVTVDAAVATIAPTTWSEQAPRVFS